MPCLVIDGRYRSQNSILQLCTQMMLEHLGGWLWFRNVPYNHSKLSSEEREGGGRGRFQAAEYSMQMPCGVRTRGRLREL